MIPIGMFRERRRIRKSLVHEAARLPRIDLNDPSHRNAFVIFTITTIVVLFLSTLGSFKAYHITESVEFCGTLCHQVMEPEHTAYQNSPHANVACVECHVGSGASWYVKSKLSGLHQVYAVLTKTFPTPIETPLHDLRPARETCEKCHWPQKFYARTLWTNKYFLADSLNTEWDIMLQMKTGPEYSGLGLKEGIHWHINPAVNIEYISENDKRENITYVKYTNKSTGEVTIYQKMTIILSLTALFLHQQQEQWIVSIVTTDPLITIIHLLFISIKLCSPEQSQKTSHSLKKSQWESLRETFNDKGHCFLKIKEGDYKLLQIRL